ncbi:outer membrane protein, OMP85 family, putative [Coleofasciculus chthonoplastes PCC 7420]|uniref:Outer membrane protein, OMP85 family, putative n=1 Tax=Coleofasciculus chthonoplastes PCC 7420 TaxID=118168 RepID=B4W0X5_9CYAN|nr:ShlB/FhaC/HecB family hemolysin secretion/activation protein [Coleofasciculus chthonoplastes]EDX72165.1 outer membrane protein, OMP85 family, putative [Coleofasciculus chthonoplastes PCC 7420]
MAAPLSLQGCLLILPLVWLMTGSGFRATANPDHVFTSATGLGEVEMQHLTDPVVQLSPPNSEAEASSLLASACPDTHKFHQQHSAIAFPVENIPGLTIKVIGNTVFSREEVMDAVREVTQPLEKRYVTVRFLLTAPEKYTQRKEFADLKNVLENLPNNIAGAITDLYLTKGYINSQAEVSSFENGVVEICVIEGSLEQIQIFEIIETEESGSRQITDSENQEENTEVQKVEVTGRWASYIRDRIQLGTGTPLNTAELEDQLRLLRDDPIIGGIEARLVATGERGQTNLNVHFTKVNPFEGSVRADNFSPPSVGSERLGVELSHRNLAVVGDRISFSRSATLGADVVDLGYRLPLNSMNGTLTLRIAPNRNDIIQSEFDDFDIRGETDLYEIVYRQPLIRKPREEFALSLGFTFQEGQTFIFDSLGIPFGIGPDEDGVSRTSVIQFGQEYLRRSSRGAWFLGSQFSFGTGFFDATANEGEVPDGQFLSWLGQVQRVQRISGNHLLVVQAELQLTPGSLLPAQQFVIGGGQSVRGYRQNVRSGDNGFRFSIEDRITLERNQTGVSTLLLAPFFDAGIVWNHPDNPNQLPSDRFLAALGLGLIVQPESQLSFRFDWGIPLNLLDDRDDNFQDLGYYFSVNYRF